LIVEDDAELAASLVRRLRSEGYDIELSTDGEDARARIARRPADLVLLDLMLPRLHGHEVLKKLTAASVPTIVLTARTSLEDRLRCFELGAVDYVPKPFFLDEITARVRARLSQRQRPHPRAVVAWADVVFDLDARTVHRAGTPVALTRYELAALAYLVERPDRAVSRATLAENAFPSLDAPSDRTIDSHLVRVRKKLGPAGAAIVTVWGVGYRYSPDSR
jgi:DNA-binding response OmpR family regulator